MTLVEAIVELRGLDPYCAYPITDAQEEAARTLIAAVERVRRHREDALEDSELASFAHGVLAILDGAP